MNTKEIFARNLRNLLYARNKTQSDLARGLKTTPTTVSHWVNAEMLPRSNMIDRICFYLNCTTEDLMIDHTKVANVAPSDVIANAILERPILMQLFVMADKADDDTIYKCIKLLGERK